VVCPKSQIHPILPLFLSPAGEQNCAGELLEIENQFRVAIRDAVNRPSRKPFYWGGLQGYRQLEAIGQVLHAMPVAGNAYFSRLIQQVDRTLEKNRALAEELDQTHSWFLRIAACLRYPPSSHPDAPQTTRQPVEQEMLELLQDFAADAHRQVIPLRLYHGLGYRWKMFGAELLHCFEIPGLPPDHLQIEGLFGRLRRHQRRISGRKSTQPLRDFGQCQIRFLATSREQLLEQLRRVPVQAYQEYRKRLALAESPRQFLSRLHRDPAKAMSQLAESYTKRQAELARKIELSLPNTN
jgi:hypothetical protein